MTAYETFLESSIAWAQDRLAWHEGRIKQLNAFGDDEEWVAREVAWHKKQLSEWKDHIAQLRQYLTTREVNDG